MMAALQVQEALKLLHGMPVAAGSALVYNGVANQFYSTKLPFREDCLSHETYPPAIELPLGQEQTVGELFQAVRPHLAGRLHLVLDRELVVAIECPRCDLAQRGDAAAGEGQVGRGRMPELPRACPAGIRKRYRRRLTA